MLLIVGLGNPGAKYSRHRHNVGFMAVDAIADAHRFGPARKKFQAELREGLIGGEKTLIVKPQTYMNESGQSVGAALRFYKLKPEQVFVFHDELDLAAGKIRMKSGGGNAGHNGLKSIDDHIGASFHRIRIGIGHPGPRERVTGHVLGDFSKADEIWLTPLLDALAKAAPNLARKDIVKYQSDVARFAPAARAEKPQTGETEQKS